MSENQPPVTGPEPKPEPLEAQGEPSPTAAQPMVVVGGHASGPVAVPQSLTTVEPPEKQHWYAFIYRVFRGTPKRYAELLALFIVSPLLIVLIFGAAYLGLVVASNATEGGGMLAWLLMPVFWGVVIGWYVLYFSVLVRSVMLFVRSFSTQKATRTTRAVVLYALVAVLLIVPFLIPAQSNAANAVERKTMTAYAPSKSISDIQPTTKRVTAIQPTSQAKLERTNVPRTYTVTSEGGQEFWNDIDTNTLRYSDFGGFEVYEVYKATQSMKVYVTNSDIDYLVSNQADLLRASYIGTSPKDTKVRAVATPACNGAGVAVYAYAAELAHNVKVLIEIENRVPGQPLCTASKALPELVAPPPEMLQMDRVYAYIDSIKPYTITFASADRTPARSTLFSADSIVEQVVFRPFNHVYNLVQTVTSG